MKTTFMTFPICRISRPMWIAVFGLISFSVRGAEAELAIPQFRAAEVRELAAEGAVRILKADGLEQDWVGGAWFGGRFLLIDREGRILTGADDGGRWEVALDAGGNEVRIADHAAYVLADDRAVVVYGSQQRIDGQADGNPFLSKDGLNWNQPGGKAGDVGHATGLVDGVLRGVRRSLFSSRDAPGNEVEIIAYRLDDAPESLASDFFTNRFTNRSGIAGFFRQFDESFALAGNGAVGRQSPLSVRIWDAVASPFPAGVHFNDPRVHAAESGGLGIVSATAANGTGYLLRRADRSSSFERVPLPDGVVRFGSVAAGRGWFVAYGHGRGGERALWASRNGLQWVRVATLSREGEEAWDAPMRWHFGGAQVRTPGEMHLRGLDVVRVAGGPDGFVVNGPGGRFVHFLPNLRVPARARSVNDPGEFVRSEGVVGIGRARRISHFGGYFWLHRSSGDGLEAGIFRSRDGLSWQEFPVFEEVPPLPPMIGGDDQATLFYEDDVVIRVTGDKREEIGKLSIEKTYVSRQLAPMKAVLGSDPFGRDFRGEWIRRTWDSILVSKDGTSWRHLVALENIEAIFEGRIAAMHAVGDRIFVLADNGRVFVSGDGLAWDRLPGFPEPQAADGGAGGMVYSGRIFGDDASGIFVMRVRTEEGRNVSSELFHLSGNGGCIEIPPPDGHSLAAATLAGGRLVAVSGLTHWNASPQRVDAWDAEGGAWTSYGGLPSPLSDADKLAGAPDGTVVMHLAEACLVLRLDPVRAGGSALAGLPRPVLAEGEGMRRMSPRPRQAVMENPEFIEHRAAFARREPAALARAALELSSGRFHLDDSDNRWYEPDPILAEDLAAEALEAGEISAAGILADTLTDWKPTRLGEVEQRLAPYLDSSPEVAFEIGLALARSKQARPRAREYLTRHPDHLPSRDALLMLDHLEVRERGETPSDAQQIARFTALWNDRDRQRLTVNHDSEIRGLVPMLQGGSVMAWEFFDAMLEEATPATFMPYAAMVYHYATSRDALAIAKRIYAQAALGGWYAGPGQTVEGTWDFFGPAFYELEIREAPHFKMLSRAGTIKYAVRRLKEVADAGEPKAMLLYARLLWNGFVVPSTQVRNEWEHLVAMDRVEAARWLEKAVDAGVERAAPLLESARPAVERAARRLPIDLRVERIPTALFNYLVELAANRNPGAEIQLPEAQRLFVLMWADGQYGPLEEDLAGELLARRQNQSITIVGADGRQRAFRRSVDAARNAFRRYFPTDYDPGNPGYVKDAWDFALTGGPLVSFMSNPGASAESREEINAWLVQMVTRTHSNHPGNFRTFSEFLETVKARAANLEAKPRESFKKVIGGAMFVSLKEFRDGAPGGQRFIRAATDAGFYSEPSPTIVPPPESSPAIPLTTGEFAKLLNTEDGSGYGELMKVAALGDEERELVHGVLKGHFHKLILKSTVEAGYAPVRPEIAKAFSAATKLGSEDAVKAGRNLLHGAIDAANAPGEDGKAPLPNFIYNWIRQ